MFLKCCSSKKRNKSKKKVNFSNKIKIIYNYNNKMKIESQNPKEDIEKKRPNLKENTIKQYLTNLNKLKNLFDSKDFSFLGKPNDVKEKIQYLHDTSQRNHYNAIIVLLSAINEDDELTKIINEYGKMRDELNDKYIEQNKTGIISDKQAPNFVDISEVNKMIETMGQEIKSLNLKKKKDNLSSKEKALLQVYLLFNIYTRIPLRNDVAGMESITKRQYNK